MEYLVKIYSLQTAFRSLSVFLMHLSGYTIGIIGIDRYVRIKHYASFKALWTKRAVLSLICAVLLLALFQVLLVEIALKFRKEKIFLPINMAIDSILIRIVVFLQVKTIRTSNAVADNSSLVDAERINKIITKLKHANHVIAVCVSDTVHHIDKSFTCQHQRSIKLQW